MNDVTPTPWPADPGKQAAEAAALVRYHERRITRLDEDVREKEGLLMSLTRHHGVPEHEWDDWNLRDLIQRAQSVLDARAKRTAQRELVDVLHEVVPAAAPKVEG